MIYHPQNVKRITYFGEKKKKGSPIDMTSLTKMSKAHNIHVDMAPG